ncbi:MAG: DUF3007 family protein [Cyanobacteriota bacterium]|nr:DUF3007 family protein [Cyanobacteriota bacterium]
MTRGQALLLGLGVLALGAIGWWGFQASGLEGFTPGLAASALLTLVVIGWTGSYLFRVVSGKMTYMEQRRRYRATYDARTDAELLARFEALSPDEQEALLREVGQLKSQDEGSPAGDTGTGEGATASELAPPTP